MHTTKSDQRGSDVDGDQVGRDKITNNHHYGHRGPVKPTAMSRLIDKYEREEENATPLYELIRQLRHFSATSDYDVRGIEEKLRSSDRLDILKQAMSLKENAAKDLIKAPNSESAQKIYALILGEMCTNFIGVVDPMIRSGKSRDEIDLAIHEHVITPAYESLETNPLVLTKMDIFSLYYFLAGNCHISWDAQ
tara:strand:- start:376 stop:954 length:579 start_codon:yes stop_codon:yes gene_type:complete